MEDEPTWKAKVMISVVATLVALLIAEWGASALRDGAFPYLNIYVSDPVLGVRLEPDTETATKSREGRVTVVTTNRQGFRGPDWTPAESNSVVPGRVMILGDSQMLGYGVDFPESTAPQLTGALGSGWEVLPAAVPTWGPQEYVAIAKELVPVYRPQVVVYVANVANDWFEAPVSNTIRTTERDGWAAQVLAGSEPPTAFPGRRMLLGRSHLVYAMRQAWRGGSSKVQEARGISAHRLLKELPRLRLPSKGFHSRISSHVAEVRDLCATQGCTVVTAVLPMDVQVHPAEWAKYRQDKPVNIRPTMVLGAALMADTKTLGVVGVDLTAPLRRASPGAFLPDDYHMSPKGHRACAKALAFAVRQAAATQPSSPDLAASTKHSTPNSER